MNIINVFQRPQLTNSTSIQECPNCWGYSEWANQQTRALFLLNKGSLKEMCSRDGFIRKFMSKYLY